MAGKYGGKSVGFLVAGYNMIANKLQALRYKLDSQQEASHGLGDSAEESAPVGLSKFELVQEGAFWDTSAGNIHAAVSGAQPTTPQAVPRVAVVWFAGSAVNRLFIGFQGLYHSVYEVLGQRGQLQRANVEHKVSGKAEHGVILHPHGIETSDGNTEVTSADHTTEDGVRSTPIASNSVANPTVVTTTVPHGLTTGETVLISGSNSTPTIDGERTVTVLTATTFSVPVNVTVGGSAGSFVRAKTKSGGAGYLQVEDLTLGGYTDVLVTLRDSTDNVVFADLGVFTAVTVARTAERIEAAGDVERYLAVSHDFRGAGAGASIKYFAGFARF